MARSAARIYVTAVVRTVLVLINNFYCIPTYLLWMLILRPLLYLYPDLYWAIEGALYRWLLAMVAGWMWSSGFAVAETGDDLSGVLDDECLVLVNHQSTGDVPTLMYWLQSKKHLNTHSMWIMDLIFQYSNFGWVSCIHGDFFIQQGRDVKTSQLTQLRDHMLTKYFDRGRKWILLFPEGGFLRKRLEKSQSYAKRHGYPVLRHLALPRIGAMETILTSLSNRTQDGFYTRPEKAQVKRPLKWVLEITIGYPERKPLDMFCIVWGNRDACLTTLHCRKYSATGIPSSGPDLQTWLFDRYAEKDAILEDFYNTGHFSSNLQNGSCKHQQLPHGPRLVPHGPRLVPFDYWWYFRLHAFFIISSLFHFCLITHLATWCYFIFI